MNEPAFIESIDIIWIVPVSFFIHELEEWNILRWYGKHFTDLPASTETSVRIHIFTLGAAAFLLTFIARISPPIIGGPLIVFMSGFVLTNATQHAIQTFQYKTYAPGLATGLLCTACCAYANIIWILNGMIFMPCYVIVASGIPAVVKTIRLKHRMTPEVRKVHEFFIRIENLVYGTGAHH